MKYQATIKILVEGEDNYSRATEHWLHALVQDSVVGQWKRRSVGGDAALSVIGASCIDVKKLED